MNKKTFAKLILNKNSIKFALCFVGTEVRIHSNDLFEQTSGRLLYADKDGFLVLQDGRYTLTPAILIPLNGFVFNIPAAFLNRTFVRVADDVQKYENRYFAITKIISNDSDRFQVVVYDDGEPWVVYKEQILPAFDVMSHYVPDMTLIET